MGSALAELPVPLAQHDFDGEDIGPNLPKAVQVSVHQRYPTGYGFVLQTLCMDHLSFVRSTTGNAGSWQAINYIHK
jgi:hypothetical protein